MTDDLRAAVEALADETHPAPPPWPTSGDDYYKPRAAYERAAVLEFIEELFSRNLLATPAPEAATSYPGLRSGVCMGPDCTIPRKPGFPMHGPHDFIAGKPTPAPDLPTTGQADRDAGQVTDAMVEALAKDIHETATLAINTVYGTDDRHAYMGLRIAQKVTEGIPLPWGLASYRAPVEGVIE